MLQSTLVVFLTDVSERGKNPFLFLLFCSGARKRLAFSLYVLNGFQEPNVIFRQSVRAGATPD
jgi:hypothetical protein